MKKRKIDYELLAMSILFACGFTYFIVITLISIFR